jgi:hypothetical protein
MTLRLTRLGPILAGWLVLLLLCAAARGDDPVPADPEPRWWKGNLHTHTLWSDGDNFPEMVAEWYRTNGWNFLALSDHNILSQGQKWMPAPEVEKRAGKIGIDAYIERFGPHWIERRYNSEKGVEEIRLKPLSEFRALVEERGRFIMIQSEEISARFENKPIHLNATNILELIKPQTGGSVVETIENNLRAVVEQSERTGQEMLPHINHPNFGWAITAEELAEVVSENFFEVYNGHPGVNQLGDEHRPSLDPMWDIANTLRLAKLNLPPLYGLGTDDSRVAHPRAARRRLLRLHRRNAQRRPLLSRVRHDRDRHRADGRRHLRHRIHRHAAELRRHLQAERSRRCRRKSYPRFANLFGGRRQSVRNG